VFKDREHVAHASRHSQNPDTRPRSPSSAEPFGILCTLARAAPHKGVVRGNHRVGLGLASRLAPSPVGAMSELSERGVTAHRAEQYHANNVRSHRVEPTATAIRLLIVTDIRLYRDGLRQILSARENVETVETAASGQEALERVGLYQSSIVLLDRTLPHSLDTARALVDAYPSLRIVMLGLTEGDEEVLACAEAGVVGYVSRDGSVDDLVSAFESASRGELLCSPRTAATLIRRVAALAGRRQPDREAIRLTEREREIVRLIDQGLSNKEIADRLEIEVATVKNHVHNILEKLHVSRRGQAAAWVRRSDALASGGPHSDR
jgi:two-component system nitrate/nitrite response regulator NarL